MNILSIYKKYKIPKSLQEHQLRVAAVGQLLCDNLTVPANKTDVITALLLHDMGNLLKFDLNAMPQLLQPEGVEYWQKVKSEMAQTYQTTDEHEASIKIAGQLGVNQNVIDCIESISFIKAVHNADEAGIGIKVCDYADIRVDPYGVVSMADRLAEGNKRYKNRADKWMADDEREAILAAYDRMEANIFANCKIKPTDITNQSVAPIIDQLKSYTI